MQGLGKMQSTSQVLNVNKVTLKRTAPGKRGGIRGIRPRNAPAAVDISASLKQRLDRELKSSDNPSETVNTRSNQLRKSFPEWIREILAELANGKREVVQSESDTRKSNIKVDRNFGVEPLSYKNMWNVLKTVVKEIGVIKEAHHGKFFLGVSERIDKATTLMEFGSLADYLEENSDAPLKNKLSGTPKVTDGPFAFDPVTLLQAQANIVPKVALQLLTWAG